MLHPFEIISRDDFGLEIIDWNNAGVLALKGGPSTLEPEPGKSCAEFRPKFSTWLKTDRRGDVLGHLRSTATS